MKPVVGYALNSNPYYWKLLDISLSSLRGFNSEIEVLVYAYGRIPAGAKRTLSKHGASLVRRKAPSGALANWSLKWRSVGEIPSRFDCVLFIDVDTCFYDDPEKLLRRHRVKSFYARKDIGFGKDEKHGPVIIRDRLNRKAYRQMAEKLGSQTLPVFNSSVMIWNHGSHRAWRKLISRFLDVHAFLESQHDLLGIVSRIFFLDEIAGSLCIGLIPRLSWGLIRKSDVSWYTEWKFHLRKSNGVLMHIGATYAKNWAETPLNDFISPSELSRLARTNGVRLIDPGKLRGIR